jgi:murein L,D-transpeptidase YafK
MERIPHQINRITFQVMLLLLLSGIGFPKMGYSHDTMSVKTREFLYQQLQHIRVFDAFASTNLSLLTEFEQKGVSYPPKFIYWRAFKWEKSLELWAKNDSSDAYTLIKTYPIYQTCGDLGPKRRQGDMQIPEGFYNISKFNPNSLFWLSFQINYPNKSDSILGYKSNLGGDIYIHGDTVTIGCLPLTDSLIKEVFWISLRTHAWLDSNENIPFHIFPTRLHQEGWKQLQKNYWSDKSKLTFWNSLQAVYDYFEDSKQLPIIQINDKGHYQTLFQNRHQKRTVNEHGHSNSRIRESGG